MKYNPKVNEDVAALPGFAAVHPQQPAATAQGALELLSELQAANTNASDAKRIRIWNVFVREGNM